MEYLTTKEINKQIDKLERERRIYWLSKIKKYYDRKIAKLRTLKKEMLKKQKRA